MKFPLESTRLALIFRYFLSGGATYALNLTAVWAFLQIPGWHDSELTRNTAHFLGMEMAILFSFHVHKYFTWKSEGAYLAALYRFHVIAMATAILRQILFFLLDRAGSHWFLSTTAPLAIAILLNFVGYNRLFHERKTSDSPKE